MINFKNEKELDLNINKYKKITNISSILRISIFILLVIFLIMLFSLQDYLLYGIISGVIFVLFIFIMLFTNKYYYHLEHLKIKKEIYNKHYKRRSHDLNTFFDTGSDFLESDDYKESDLDLFGSNSLFQYLNSAKTKKGRMRLSNLLKHGQPRNIEYTNAINELSNNEYSIDIEASIAGVSNQASKLDYNEILSTINTKIKLNILSFLPLLSFIGMIIYTILVFTINLNPFLIIPFILANFILTRICNRCNAFNIKASLYLNLIDSYIDISNIFIKNNYESKLLNEYKNDLIKYLPKLKSIKSIIDILSFRANFVFLLLGNSLFISDLFIILLFNNKVKKNEDVNHAFDIISDIEAILSLSNIGIDNEIYCIPENNDNITFEDIYHPLVKDCISNSININEGIILTGSNMSGKTTFLRTLGIAYILYNAGGVVPAKSFRGPSLDIYTSLRANDMLKEGVSTFYAEILRMKKINEAIKKGPCLVLIDEIFKGTNLNERLEASFKIIEKLNSYNAFFIISTHDEKITEANNIINYHFSEYYENDKIKFDYKIKPGKSETTNAIYLLKMADII